MDEATTVILGALSGFLSAGVGEAGKQAWAAFESLVRKHFGRRSAERGLALRIDDGDLNAVDPLANLLAAAARADEVFAQVLWQTLGLSAQSPVVQLKNEVTGNVTGTSIQAGHIGDIHIKNDR